MRSPVRWQGGPCSPRPGSGIGAAAASRLADGVARAAVTDLDADAAGRVCDSICTAGGTAASVQCDVTSPAAWNACVEQVTSTYGWSTCSSLRPAATSAGRSARSATTRGTSRVGLLRSAMLGVGTCPVRTDQSRRGRRGDLLHPRRTSTITAPPALPAGPVQRPRMPRLRATPHRPPMLP